MQAGKLRHLITIEQQVPGATTSAYNTPTLTWATQLTAWASVSPITGREMQFAKGFAETVSHKIVTRYQAGITVRNRVNFGGRFFTINAVLNEDERNRMLTLMCTEAVNPPTGS